MKTLINHGLLLISVSLTLAKDVDLPLCPTNLQYFPQNLPMHCRMPGSSDSNQNQGYPGMQQYATMPPMSPPYYQSPPPDKQPNPIPIPMPPFPGMPGGMGPPMPGMPGSMPMPMPMPMPMVGGPPHKLPVIVMPFYSPDNSFKRPPAGPPYRDPNTKPPRKKRKKSYDSDGDTSNYDTSSAESSDEFRDSGEHGWWKGHKKSGKKGKITRRFNRRHKSKKRKDKKKKDLLTPILQYVTKDGYVIFEKKISKNEAKDWLKPKNDVRAEEEVKNEENNVLEEVQKSAEVTSKPEVEEVVLKAEEKNSEEVTENKSTTTPPSQKLYVRKHRQRKINDLINQPEPEP